MPDITMLQVPITYDLNDRIVSAARRAGLKKRQFVIRVLEEKLNEHRPQSAKTSEAGTIVYPSNEERIN